MRFAPSKRDAELEIERMTDDDPLRVMIGSGVLRDGRPAAAVGSLEDDRNGRLVMQIAELIRNDDLLLDRALRKVVATHSLDSEKVLDFLYRSPFFDAGRRELLRAGLGSYFEGDHTSAAHVLLPQIEHCLRGQLRKSGLPDTTVGKNGVTPLKTLGAVLADLQPVLDEDLRSYLLTLLADERGLNLRNEVCHGFLPPEAFSAQMTNRIVHALLALTMVQSDGSARARPSAAATDVDDSAGR